MDRAVMNTAVRKMVTDIRYAQQMALAEARVYYITFNRSLQLYRISFAAHPMQKTVRQVPLPDGLRLIGTNFPDNRLHFTELGAPSRGGTIELVDARGQIISVTVLPATGRVRVYR